MSVCDGVLTAAVQPDPGATGSVADAAGYSLAMVINTLLTTY